MSTAKEAMAEILSRQPDDSSYDELLRELAYARTVQAGLADSDAGRTITDDEMRAQDSIVAEIIWTTRAADGLEQIHVYIARDNPDAAQQVAAAIYDKIQLLRKHPRLGQRYEAIVDREVREILYGHYRIAYLIKNEDRIEIVAIFHSAMDIDRYFEWAIEMNDNPYHPGIVFKDAPKTRATRWLVISGIGAMMLGIICTFASRMWTKWQVDYMINSEVTRTNDHELEIQFEFINISLYPMIFAGALVVLGLAMILVGHFRREPVET